jgi:collagenase-like PrtC family protease
LVFDKEIPALVEYLRRLCRMGADAVMLSDPGAITAARQAVPGLAIHAGGL